MSYDSVYPGSLIRAGSHPLLVSVGALGYDPLRVGPLKHGLPLLIWLIWIVPCLTLQLIMQLICDPA